jgi:hypothetical protein
MFTNLLWNSRIPMPAPSASDTSREWFAVPVALLTLVAAGGVFLCTALAQSAPLSSAPALSQDPAPARPAQPAARHQRRVSLDERVKGLAKNLDLSEAQQAAVKRILERRQQESLRIMRTSSGTDGIGRLRALQIGTVEQIRSVLNDEQKKKYNPLTPAPPKTSPQRSVEDWMKVTTPH